MAAVRQVRRCVCCLGVQEPLRQGHRQAAFATLHKAGCDHLDTIAKRLVAVPVAEEAPELLRHTQRANNAFLSNFSSTFYRFIYVLSSFLTY